MADNNKQDVLDEGPGGSEHAKLLRVCVCVVFLLTLCEDVLPIRCGLGIMISFGKSWNE